MASIMDCTLSRAAMNLICGLRRNPVEVLERSHMNPISSKKAQLSDLMEVAGPITSNTNSVV